MISLKCLRKNLLFSESLKFYVSSKFSCNAEDYLTRREDVILDEEDMAVGGSLNLRTEEQEVDKILMNHKLEELEKGFKNPHKFPAAMHFFQAKNFIEKSNVFKIIQKLPKGGCLHLHDTSSVSFDCVKSLIMNTDNLYGCVEHGRLLMKVINDMCNEEEKHDWTPICKMREKITNFDDFLQSQCTIVVDDPQCEYPGINEVWSRFEQTFETLSGLLCYRPIFEEYFYQALKEFYQDNTRYLEVRSICPLLYDENGKSCGPLEVVEIFCRTLNRFKMDYPDFYGAKFIYAPHRTCDKETFLCHILTALKIKQRFPRFFVGFDLVGQEDTGQPLINFYPEIAGLSEKIDLFLHAGETVWNGFPVDLNVIDAVLLNAKRIGHAYSIKNHPRAMELILEKDIAIEVCPIANQVLNLVADNRNHPASVLFSRGFPLVIASDAPGIFGGKALSYDWYIAFMAMTKQSSGLKLLKQLAINSIKYSGLNEEEKKKVMKLWKTDWDKFICETLTEYS